jgi:6-phosphogluconolactonase
VALISTMKRKRNQRVEDGESRVDMNPIQQPELTICHDASDLAAHAARMIATAAQAAIAERGRFTLVLSGGSTPEKSYGLLGNGARETEIAWRSTFLFFGDERFVPTDDPSSNLGMARRSLIARVPIPPANVFPMPTDRLTADDGARAYGATIAQFFGVLQGSEPPPAFDLVLLGVGDDGHTASLFPGQPAIAVKDRWVTASPPGRLPPPVDRITLTFPILNRARQVLFLVAGEKKAEVVREVLEDHPPVEKYPAAGIRLVNGKVTWLLDEPAARRLTKAK